MFAFITSNGNKSVFISWPFRQRFFYLRFEMLTKVAMEILFSGTWHLVVWQIVTIVSEVPAASIFRA
jgi:hypothetical protein